MVPNGNKILAGLNVNLNTFKSVIDGSDKQELECFFINAVCP
jgi:hypothetical protein